MNALGNMLLNSRRRGMFWDGSNPAGWSSGFSTEVIVAGAITSAIFTNETALQTGTGASGSVINQLPGTNLGPLYGVYQGPLALVYPLTGPPPDATHTWVGQSSGAVFTPSSPGYLNPTTAFWLSSASPHINARFIRSLQFDVIFQTTVTDNASWFEIQFGNDSGGHGPALVLTKNYFSSPCGFVLATAWGSLNGDPDLGVTNPTFTKDVWHTVKITLDGAGNASWYLDNVLQSTANVGEPSQGTYIGFRARYGNNWVTNIYSQ